MVLKALREPIHVVGLLPVPVRVMVKPEGGFDPAEAKAAVDAGLQSVSLGTRILRCETAPIAALAAVLYAGGNM